MQHDDDNILDAPPPPPNAYQNNRSLSSVRYGISAFIGVNILQSLFAEYTKVSVWETNTYVYLLGMLIPVGIYGLFLYYNVLQANMEYRDQVIKPVFRRPFQLLFLVIGIGIIILNIMHAAQSWLSSGIVVVGVLIILRREWRYFQSEMEGV